MSIADKNRLYNSRFGVKGLLYYQRSEPLCKMRFGIRPMSFNGCGIIAVYNVLILLGRPDTIQNIAYHYERNGRWLWGLWGIKPWKIGSFLLKKGFDVNKCDYRKEKNGIYILLVLNKGGLHYMAVRKFKSGMIEVYNGYVRKNTFDTYNGFNQFFDETKVACIQLYKITKPK